MNNSIQDEIKQFILKNIDSVVHLEVILLLGRDHEVGWDPIMIAECFLINERQAADILIDLHKGGFTAIKKNDFPRVRYQPNSWDVETMIVQMDRLYTNSSKEVVDLIQSKKK